MLTTISSKYNIIYADPPWSYRDRGCNGAAEKHYSTMSLADIKALPMKDIAADNCALFLWATYPMFGEALEVLKAWDFIYKTIAFQWIKTYPKSGKYVFGLGNWTRANSEPCILAIRGKPKRQNKGVSQLIFAPRGKHSAKPGVVREKIVDVVGDLPRIELFAREKTLGWDCWGDEIDE